MNHSDIEHLLCAIAEERIPEALRLEKELYLTLVKRTDTDEHYRACFEMWAEPMQEMGRKNAYSSAQGPAIAFFLHATSLLAHVGVLREVIANRGERECVVFALGEDVGALKAYLGVPCYALGKDPCTGFDRMLSMMMAGRCGTLVWVSAPLYANYALATRMAERQVYWSMRFHPVSSMQEIDRYITQGRRSEKVRTYHGQEWSIGHAPLSVAKQAVNVNEAERYRLQFGVKHLIGTVAREEKISNPDYLQCIADALKAVPDSLFLWTGKHEREDIRQFFADQGLARRHRFLGWVEPDKFMPLVDVFCETFPQGGTMTWLAMAHGVPVVGLNHQQAVYGWLEEIPKDAGIAVNLAEYTHLVVQFMTDIARAKRAADAGRLIYEKEIVEAKADCRNIWALIDK